MPSKDVIWNTNCDILEEYCRQFGTCNCPKSCVCVMQTTDLRGTLQRSVVNIGRWLKDQRRSKKGALGTKLTPAREVRLQALVDVGKLWWEIKGTSVGKSELGSEVGAVKRKIVAGVAVNHGEHESVSVNGGNLGAEVLEDGSGVSSAGLENSSNMTTASTICRSESEERRRMAAASDAEEIRDLVNRAVNFYCVETIPVNGDKYNEGTEGGLEGIAQDRRRKVKRKRWTRSDTEAEGGSPPRSQDASSCSRYRFTVDKVRTRAEPPFTGAILHEEIVLG